MEKAIWQMQQEAEMRVRRMQEHSRHLVDRNRRSESSLRAAREAVEAIAPRPQKLPAAPAPPPTPVSDCAGNDPERIFLLALALLLHRSGATLALTLAVLYLAL